jgi:hypothetical protein
MRIDLQWHIVEWLLDATDRSVHICQHTIESSLWDDD